MPSNQHEERARQVKAGKIADYIWAHMKPADKIDPETLMVIRGATQEMRDLVAHQAGCKSPSPETWGLVTKTMSERLQAERWGKGQAS